MEVDSKQIKGFGQQIHPVTPVVLHVSSLDCPGHEPCNPSFIIGGNSPGPQRREMILEKYGCLKMEKR
jgi:hypothetical protein